MASDTIAMSNGGCTVAKKKGHHGTETHSKASKKDKKQNYKRESAISQSPAFTQVLKSQHNPIMNNEEAVHITKVLFTNKLHCNLHSPTHLFIWPKHISYFYKNLMFEILIHLPQHYFSSYIFPFDRVCVDPFLKKNFSSRSIHIQMKLSV